MGFEELIVGFEELIVEFKVLVVEEDEATIGYTYIYYTLEATHCPIT